MARVASDVASPYLAGTFLMHFHPELAEVLGQPKVFFGCDLPQSNLFSVGGVKSDEDRVFGEAVEL